jgi:hypothetical protein
MSRSTFCANESPEGDFKFPLTLGKVYWNRFNHSTRLYRSGHLMAVGNIVVAILAGAGTDARIFVTVIDTPIAVLAGVVGAEVNL